MSMISPDFFILLRFEICMITNMLISNKNRDLLTELFDEGREFNKRLTKVLPSSSLFHLTIRSFLLVLLGVWPAVAIS